MLFDVILSVCGRAELVPEGVASVQRAAGVHGAPHRRRRRQGSPVCWITLLHRQGIAGTLSVELKLYIMHYKIHFQLTSQ